MEQNHSKITYRHNLSATAVVCEDGSTGILGLVYKNPVGLELVGNGTLPHPLSAQAKNGYSIISDDARDALIDLAKSIIANHENPSSISWEVYGHPIRDKNVDLVSKAREAIAKARQC